MKDLLAYGISESLFLVLRKMMQLLFLFIKEINDKSKVVYLAVKPCNLIQEGVLFFGKDSVVADCNFGRNIML